MKRLVLLLAAIVLSAGCAQDRCGHASLEGGGTRLVYDASIDRILYLGAQAGPSVLGLAPDLYRPLRPNSYDFRGGNYVWLAPQEEWVNDAGKPANWPPDPQMDIGPASVLEHTNTRLAVQGPALKRHVQVHKSMELQKDGSLAFLVTLLPAGKPQGSMSIWSTTTVPRGTIIAVRKGSMRFDSPGFATAWLTAARQVGPWLLVDTEKLAVAGKVFISTAPVVAAWREGQWFVRAGSDADSPRHAANGIVEIYVDRDKNLIELELIGPYRPVDQAGSNQWKETWRIIPSEKANADVLDGGR